MEREPKELLLMAAEVAHNQLGPLDQLLPSTLNLHIKGLFLFEGEFYTSRCKSLRSFRVEKYGMGAKVTFKSLLETTSAKINFGDSTIRSSLSTELLDMPVECDVQCKLEVDPKCTLIELQAQYEYLISLASFKFETIQNKTSLKLVANRKIKVNCVKELKKEISFKQKVVFDMSKAW